MINKIFSFENNANLYLSGIQPLYNSKNIQKLKIGVILTVIDNETLKNISIPNAFKEVKHYQFNIDDSPTEDISKIFDTTFRIIYQSLLNGENVLVHCAMGISRSVSVIIAFFLKCVQLYPKVIGLYIPKTRPTWTDSILLYIKSKRSIVFPNYGFMEQLRQYEKELKIDS